MLGCLEAVCLFEISILKKEPGHFGGKKDHCAKEKEEYGDTLYVMHRVVRVESNTIQRHPIRILILLDLDPVGIVGAHFVERENMQHHQGEQYDGQCHHVQSEEAVEGDARNEVIASNPGNDVVTNNGNRAKQRDNDLGSPVGHLAPWQHITHKSLCH